MPVEVTVGIDIGTTSVKALAVDGNGEVVGRARVPHGLLVPAPDLMEHDALSAWRRGPKSAMAAALRDATARLPASAQVAGVCTAAMVPSMTAVDARGIPRTPGLLYGDARSAAGGATQPGSSEEVSGFLRWTAEESPQARGYWPAQAVANYALGARGVIDTATAFTYFPLHSGLAWDEELLSVLGAVPEQMPEVAPLGEAVSKVDGAALASGSIDALGEQMVAGASNDGDVLVICGSTLVVWLVVPEWIEVPGLWTVPHTVAGKTLIGGASNAGGLFLQWISGLLGFASLERAIGRLLPPGEPGGAVGEDASHKALASVPQSVRARPRRATSHAIDRSNLPVWSPYPRGERTPLQDPARRAAIAGLDLTHGPAAVLRAALEATGFVVRHHLDLAVAALADVPGAKPRRIVATGGGSRSGAWMQALADTTGLPVEAAAVPEGAALGAAFIARMAAGLESSLDASAGWATTGSHTYPSSAWIGTCTERYLRFRELADGAGASQLSADERSEIAP